MRLQQDNLPIIGPLVKLNFRVRLRHPRTTFNITYRLDEFRKVRDCLREFSRLEYFLFSNAYMQSTDP